MALKSTIYRFQLEISDIDSSLYESLDLRVACHPSEDPERMVVRVLARALAHEEGLDFGRGLSNADDPALWARSAADQILTWIDVGLPGADRLHRASKRAARVRIYTTKPAPLLRKEWSSRSIHKADSIEVVRLPQSLVSDLATELNRSMQWYLTVQDNMLTVGDGDRSLDGPLERTTLAQFLSDA